MRTNLSSQFDAATIAATKAHIVARNTFERFTFKNGKRVKRIVRLHATDIVTVTYRPGKLARYTLNSGGYRTMTTRGRINSELSPHYSVTSGDGFWFVRDSLNGNSVPFFDGITLPDALYEGAQNKRAWRQHEREAALKDAIKNAVAKLPKAGAIPFDVAHHEPVHENKYFGYDTSGARGQGDDRLLSYVKAGNIPGAVVRDAITWSGRNPSYFGYGKWTNQMVRRYLGAKLGLVVR